MASPTIFSILGTRALWKLSQQHSSSNPLFVKVIFGGLWCTGHRSLLMRMRIACSIDEVISM
uniref:Uncharacterized protein n=1 Tax=Myoviridae sp. ctfrL10 TaxID=2826678 RepID=A0A8S5MSE3_9CAUD|nr:MAG TPA: hypothetical protein [Myoviridae sp. ctfrL10]